MSLPLVNSNLRTVELPLGSNDHVCDINGRSGTQSLFAVGSDVWIGPGCEMMTVLTRLDGQLQSACIDNTSEGARPANAFPLHFGTHGTPMLPIAGAEYSQASAATRESMIDVAFEILRRVNPTERYVHKHNALVQGAANAALLLYCRSSRMTCRLPPTPQRSWGRTGAVTVRPRAGPRAGRSAMPPSFLSPAWSRCIRATAIQRGPPTPALPSAVPHCWCSTPMPLTGLAVSVRPAPTRRQQGRAGRALE